MKHLCDIRVNVTDDSMCINKRIHSRRAAIFIIYFFFIKTAFNGLPIIFHSCAMSECYFSNHENSCCLQSSTFALLIICTEQTLKIVNI